MKIAHSLHHAEIYATSKRKWAKNAHNQDNHRSNIKRKALAKANRERLAGLTALYHEWEQCGSPDPEYMGELVRRIERERQLLRYRSSS